jgi:ring-1,2-phenylacetyl-CoA epoxidase subunit PaaD
VSPPRLSTAQAWQVAASVPDPELACVTIADIGILRDVRQEHGRLVVTLSPTYSGCPALSEIVHDVRRRLCAAGAQEPDVRIALQPAWTSDWITAEGASKLAAAGIAPPAAAAHRGGPVPISLAPGRCPVACPQCGSTDTVEQSRFSATACRALYRCETCREPFEYFKEF